MNEEIGTYSFLPLLRLGIANNIQAPDEDTSVKFRASVNVALTLTGKGIDPTETESIANPVALYGPGDIIGIESRAIIKAEPRNWITNFEPNYLPYIEFYDEDFPWRYTPAAPNTGAGRLRPWIMLVVLEEREFKNGKNIAKRPLPYIDVSNTSNIFPSKDQLWAWAHVHINEDIVKLEDHIKNEDLSSVLPRFKDTLEKNPDLAYSRIVCPRKLAPNTPYHAFLIPVFESGRLAGLGMDPTAVFSAVPGLYATYSAWDSYAEKPELANYPYYYRWYFRTGTMGDFEYLVRLLEPKPADSRVGRRDMDVQNPGLNISGIDGKLGGILKLGGALQIPFKTMAKEDKTEVLKYENWDRLDQLEALSEAAKDVLLDKDTVEKLEQDEPHEFQKDLSSFINLADDYSIKEATEANQDSALSEAIEASTEENDPDDPLITPPLCGRWHAMVQRLLHERDGSEITTSENWIHELNLDPRWRVTAGFGTKVVQAKQEEYMDAAWNQVGDILEANQRIRWGQLAREASRVFFNKHIIAMSQKSAEKALLLTTPVHKRILAQGVTVHHHVNTSLVPHAAISAPMRRIVRPRSRVMRSLRFEGKVQPDNLVERINKKAVYPARPKEVPKTVPTLENISDGLKPASVPGFILNLLSKYPWLQFLALLLAVVLLVIMLVFSASGLSYSIFGVLIAGSIYLFRRLRKWTKQVQDAESVLEEKQTPEAVDKLPRSPDFRITSLSEAFTPSRGTTDSQEAERFKKALRDCYEFVQLSGKAGTVPEFKELNTELMVDEVIKSINPDLTIPRLVLNNVLIPARILKVMGEEFKEAMVYPEIDIPMYKPLTDISADLFLPNINYIEQNSILLLETNQKFIESYMAGLNHEFARELLWREYPTDQRGSHFRQFWDASGCLVPGEPDEGALKERLRDIPQLHRWSKFSNLGDHDHREEQGDKEEEAVLVIRGELLKKYPTAVIYAHKAEWQRKGENGPIDNTLPRRFAELTDEEKKDPPPDKVKTPLYEAKVEPDIYFFGFNITIDEAKGDSGGNPNDRPGWFFVIKERPGEPRFGLDIDQSDEIYVWNDLAWKDVVPGLTDGDYIDIEAITQPIELVNPRNRNDPTLEKLWDQYDEDVWLSWNTGMNAAEVAYILYQIPVLMGVHATEMLPDQ